MIKEKEVVTKEDLALVYTAEEEAGKIIEITTDKDVEKAATILISLKTQVDTVEEKRKHYVKPAQDTVSRINKDFKKLTEPRNTLIKILKDKVVEYAYGRKKEIKDKEKEVQIDMKDRSLVLDNDMNRIFCDTGELRFKKGYQYKITNKNKLPERYHVIDEAAILKDIRAAKGQIDIPGVRIVEESIDSVAIHPDK